ncbi:MAG: YccF domain-containing protein, partial [Actinomycetota bacterium]
MLRLIGNVIWLLLAGWAMCLSYLVAGALLCLTIIGIPFG